MVSKHTDNSVKNMDQRASAYGYNNEPGKELTLSFYEKVNHEYDFDLEEETPLSKMKIITYNVWTTQNIIYSRFDDRIPYLVEILRNTDADVIFLQEVGKKFLDKMLKSDLSSKYYFSVHSDKLFRTEVTNITMILSRIPIKMSVYGVISGDHDYSFTFAEINGYFLVNVYLHAGSKNSPGVINFEKYHTYRKNQLDMIHEKITKENKTNDPVILGGDFNFHLDGDVESYPEMDSMKKFGLVDAWKLNFNGDNGLTEDTDVNLMRWNVKQQEKKFRYDGIFVPESTIVTSSVLIGTAMCFSIPFDEEVKRDVYKAHIKKAQLDLEKMRLVNGCFPWWPSDHFGVQIVLENS